MSLRQAVNRGDWVRAEAKNGSVIEGQATHERGMTGYAQLEILVQGDGGEDHAIIINVNYWDVSIVRQMLFEA